MPADPAPDAEVELPDEAYLAALAGLPQLGPARLRALVERYRAPGAWDAVQRAAVDPSVVVNPGREAAASVVHRWAAAARRRDPKAVWRQHVEAGIGVVAADRPGYPEPFAADDDPAPVLFWRGGLDHLAGMRVAVVGTRDASRYGLDVARRLGAELAEAGVAVVSGLALGIDGAAHDGVLSTGGAPPIGVVGCGLDRVYPPAHAGLWRKVAEQGVLLGEYPLGTPGAAWRFPARNRLIATLADVVVVVESHRTGGAMLTAAEAGRRGRPVLAVPGPVTAPSSEGTNQLLFEGCGPARDAADVLLALGVEGVGPRRAAEERPRPTGDARVVLDAAPWQPTSVEQLALATGMPLGRLARAVDELEDSGWLARRGGWVERIGRAGRAERSGRGGRVR